MPYDPRQILMAPAAVCNMQLWEQYLLLRFVMRFASAVPRFAALHQEILAQNQVEAGVLVALAPHSLSQVAQAQQPDHS